jgi:large subunit ribosomal protein L18
MTKSNDLFDRRSRRTRYRLRLAANGRPRLSVFRSGKHIYAQVIDDAANATIASAGSLEQLKDGAKAKTYNLAAATEVGKLIATRALEKGVKQVKFDRSGYLYHGRVKALAEAARAAGLEF